ncbi:MAG: hypothetical protein AAFV95_27615 [Bacteroidota bacterium]
MHNVQCLFVDPMPGFQYLTEARIELDQWPIAATYINNPIDALKHLHRLPTDELPEVILADLRLPFFNGLEMAYRIHKSFGHTHPNMRFYLCVCPGQDLGRYGITDAPWVDGILHKPFDESCWRKLSGESRQVAAAASYY